MPKKTLEKWQFGDFQTPIELARKAVEALRKNHNINPDIVIEPSCGKGAFVQAALESYKNSYVLGFDINPNYVKITCERIKAAKFDNRAAIEQTDFFKNDWKKRLSEKPGFILVLGNPPWVTNSELGTLCSANLPEKSNYQNRRGVDAITGASNFDISEYMIMQNVEWLNNRSGAIAMLCKYSVARKIMRQLRQNRENRLWGHIYFIDAKMHFNASVEACLLVLTKNGGNSDCEVYSGLDSAKPSYVIGKRDGIIVRDVEKYEKWSHLRGSGGDYLWRTGVKHDCAAVMELEPVNNGYRNGLGEFVDLENTYLFPLLKSSDIGNGRTDACRKTVLTPQSYIGEDTRKICLRAPKTWRYLMEHRTSLDKRRSSIYKNKPPFSIFGIGEYSFKKWKIAISGLYKKLRFTLIGPINGKPVLFDDTVNFLSFDNENEAQLIFKIISSEPAIEFLDAIIFWDEKRPITVERLGRLSIKGTAKELGLMDEYMEFKRLPLFKDVCA